ncbi:hypothetical protein [Streptomyces sp. NPDC008125]|uniref:hypothetical protein n=1 Tax=Streptomyces sp. NPDC008125 TaxID=3364811 RepID=UPI0036EF9A51
MNTDRRPLGTGPADRTAAAGDGLAPRAQLAAERLPTAPAAAGPAARTDGRRVLGAGPAAR